MHKPSIAGCRETHLVWDKERRTFVPADRQKQSPLAKFLKGPIPWSWIEQASRLSGKSLAVGLCLWRLASATKFKTVKLSNSEVAALGIDRHAKTRALKKLEAAGLIEVIHHRGRFPRVTILNAV
jgi:DNA-binding MarR family transcriptional regulator